MSTMHILKDILKDILDILFIVYCMLAPFFHLWFFFKINSWKDALLHYSAAVVLVNVGLTATTEIANKHEKHAEHISSPSP
jgi:hypothetical protein